MRKMIFTHKAKVLILFMIAFLGVGSIWLINPEPAVSYGSSHGSVDRGLSVSDSRLRLIIRNIQLKLRVRELEERLSSIKSSGPTQEKPKETDQAPVNEEIIEEVELKPLELEEDVELEPTGYELTKESPIKVTSPAEGDVWARSPGLTDTISNFEPYWKNIEWSGAPTDFESVFRNGTIKAYLEKYCPEEGYKTVGRIPPFAHGSIEWVVGLIGDESCRLRHEPSSGVSCFERDAMSLVPEGSYYIRIENTGTGEFGRSEEFEISVSEGEIEEIIGEKIPRRDFEVTQIEYSDISLDSGQSELINGLNIWAGGSDLEVARIDFYFDDWPWLYFDRLNLIQVKRGDEVKIAEVSDREDYQFVDGALRARFSIDPVTISANKGKTFHLEAEGPDSNPPHNMINVHVPAHGVRGKTTEDNEMRWAPKSDLSTVNIKVGE